MKNSVRIRAFAACAVCLALSASAAIARPTAARATVARAPFSGLTYRHQTVQLGGHAVEISDVTVDPSAVNVELIETYSFRPRRGQAQIQAQVQAEVGRSYSLREIIDGRNPALVVNGGSASALTLPLPAELVVSNGKVLSAIDMTPKRAEGILCFDARSAATIVRKEKYHSGQCVNALQSGPLIVEPDGTFGMFEDELSSPAIGRTIALIDSGGALHVLNTSEAHLYDIGKWVMTPAGGPKGGFGARVAMAIGRGNAGMAYQPTSGSRLIWGNVDLAVPSAIAFFRR